MLFMFMVAMFIYACVRGSDLMFVATSIFAIASAIEHNGFMDRKKRY